MSNLLSSNLLVVTGAGLSVSAGLPTYRKPGEGGWEQTELEHMSHVRRYGNHLDTLWEHWDDLRRRALLTQPTRAHHTLAHWQQRTSAEFTLVTQNVDGLHQRAGSPRVVEVHGTIHRAHPLHRPDESDWLGPDDTPESLARRRMRPEIVLFGERPARRVTDHIMAALARAEVVLYIGTSGNVFPVAALPGLARANGARTILVDPHPWQDMSGFTEFHQGTADDVLPTLV